MVITLVLGEAKEFHSFPCIKPWSATEVFLKFRSHNVMLIQRTGPGVALWKSND